MLHNDKELFRQAILATSANTGIDPGIVEKDYYVTLFLNVLTQRQPEIIFKGGTSLSKCYKIINRFSEDIDLGLECIEKPSEGQRKRLKENILATTEELGFVLTNPNDVRSRKSYNKYIIDFPTVFDSIALKRNLLVETSVFLKTYPVQEMFASNYIYDYFKKELQGELIRPFLQQPFALRVQSIERTFIDKIFAVADYYLDKKIMEHSRHIYDLYKLYHMINIDDSLKDLFLNVKEIRRQHAACTSAQTGIDLKFVLQEIIDNDAYKDDYERITRKLLFEDVSYRAAISVLQKIVNSKLLSES